MGEAGLVTRNLGLVNAGQCIFQNLNLSFQNGKIYIVEGPSGCGKSSLMRSLSKLESGTSGEVWLGAELLSRPSRNVFYVSQDEDLFDWLTVAGHLSFLESCGADFDMGQKLLKEFGLWPLRERYPFQLSVGERKRLSIIRALMFSPQVLILDESLSSLDRKLRETVTEHLEKWVADMGRVCIIVSHHSGEFARQDFEVLNMPELKKEM